VCENWFERKKDDEFNWIRGEVSVVYLSDLKVKLGEFRIKLVKVWE